MEVKHHIYTGPVFYLYANRTYTKKETYGYWNIFGRKVGDTKPLDTESLTHNLEVVNLILHNLAMLCPNNHCTSYVNFPILDAVIVVESK